MSPSPYAQMPIVYHFVNVPSSRAALIETLMYVPAGVCAFHDATSSVKPKPVVWTGDVHELLVMPPRGNVNA